LPRNANPDLLVGFDTSDDAGILRLTDDTALVQTVDFFTPVVDDPYAYGQIAAANALSDVYAMGGRPISVLNIACFEPSAAPASLWAEILRGMADKTHEAGAAIMGGHTVTDNEPKFGMAVTGVVDPNRMFANTEARPGDRIFLTKPLGTGILTTAAKFREGFDLEEAIRHMATLNRAAMEAGQAANVRCATDITGFGLIGHLWNVARASGVRIEIDVAALPLLAGTREMAAEGMLTGGAGRNREFVGDALDTVGVDEIDVQIALDPQTSGGLALFARTELPYPKIGRATPGDPAIVLR